MAEGERGHDPDDLPQAVTSAGTGAPAGTAGKERRRQQQREQKKQMVRTLGDVADTEAECACKAVQARKKSVLRGRQGRARVFLHKIQLIEGLILVASLRRDPDVIVGRNETVYEVGSDRALMMIFKDEFPIAAPAREISCEVELDLGIRSLDQRLIEASPEALRQLRDITGDRATT